MSTVRLYFSGERAGPQFIRLANRSKAKVLAGMRGAAKDAAAEILERGKSDIASAGNFGKRWTDGLHAGSHAERDQDGFCSDLPAANGSGHALPSAGHVCGL